MTDKIRLTRRAAIAAAGAAVVGTGVSGGQVQWHPSTDPLSLTNKTKGQLIAAIPPAVKRRIGKAALFAPLNALESQQNTDRPTATENGLVTFEPIRNDEDTVVDLRYDYRLNEADDLADLTQGHIHHASRGESDNRLFFALYAFSDLDGSDGKTVTGDVRLVNTLSDQFETVQGLPFDDAFRQEDPEVPSLGEDFIPSLAQDLLDTPREYQVNAHTLAFRTEAIRGQVRPAELGELSRSELVETVLATVGPDALTDGPPHGAGNGRGKPSGRPNGKGR